MDHRTGRVVWRVPAVDSTPRSWSTDAWRPALSGRAPSRSWTRQMARTNTWPDWPGRLPLRARRGRRLLLISTRTWGGRRAGCGLAGHRQQGVAFDHGPADRKGGCGSMVPLSYAHPGACDVGLLGQTIGGDQTGHPHHDCPGHGRSRGRPAAGTPLHHSHRAAGLVPAGGATLLATGVGKATRCRHLVTQLRRVELRCSTSTALMGAILVNIGPACRTGELKFVQRPGRRRAGGGKRWPPHWRLPGHGPGGAPSLFDLREVVFIG